MFRKRYANSFGNFQIISNILMWLWAMNGLTVPLRAKEKYGGTKVQLCVLGSSLLAKAQPFFSSMLSGNGLMLCPSLPPGGSEKFWITRNPRRLLKSIHIIAFYQKYGGKQSSILYEESTDETKQQHRGWTQSVQIHTRMSLWTQRVLTHFVSKSTDFLN